MQHRENQSTADNNNFAYIETKTGELFSRISNVARIAAPSRSCLARLTHVATLLFPIYFCTDRASAHPQLIKLNSVLPLASGCCLRQSRTAYRQYRRSRTAWNRHLVIEGVARILEHRSIKRTSILRERSIKTNRTSEDASKDGKSGPRLSGERRAPGGSINLLTMG